MQVCIADKKNFACGTPAFALQKKGCDCVDQIGVKVGTTRLTNARGPQYEKRMVRLLGNATLKIAAQVHGPHLSPNDNVLSMIVCGLRRETAMQRILGSEHLTL